VTPAGPFAVWQQHQRHGAAGDRHAGGATGHANHLAAPAMVTMQGKVFGAATGSGAFLAALP